MSSTSVVRSGYGRDWAEPRIDRRRRRSSGGFMRFLTTFCFGIAATLAWQAYGHTARQMAANAYPQLRWLAPNDAEMQTASNAPSAPVVDSPEWQELSQSVAAMRQRVDQLAVQLAAGQDQMTRDIAARVQGAERDIIDKISAAQQLSRPDATASTARRKPARQAQR